MSNVGCQGLRIAIPNPTFHQSEFLLLRECGNEPRLWSHLIDSPFR